jgi:hypothetical protein
MRWVSVIGCSATLTLPGCDGASEPEALLVHEWGTVTTRHGPDGTPDGQLNRIDSSDVLPAFVHRYEPPATKNDPARQFTKGPLVPGRPDVTMRLETPVIYFHPPLKWRNSAFDVAVQFRGGIVNEFYPKGETSLEVDTARVMRKMEVGVLSAWDGKVLDNYVLSGLKWVGLRLRDSVPLPQTESRIWLAPRAVRSVPVATADGSGERFLFYRGVAHLDAVFRTRTTPREVVLLSPPRLLWLAGDSVTVAKTWLVDVRNDGALAFRERSGLRLVKRPAASELARMERFNTADYSEARRSELRAALKAALIGAGLFEDEAEAQLETWRESYFRAPGLRVLYIVPPEWTNYHLPLTISTPNVLTRVIVGRIDLR